MDFLLKATVSLLVLWVAMVGLMAALQTSMLFPRAMVGPAPALPEAAERLQLAHDGAVLQGVLITGDRADLPLLLGFGGNAWNAEDVALFLHRIAPDHPVAAFHYRGYAPSTGHPSAAALLADGLALHDLLAPRAPQGMVALGFSIGSGVAAHLAQARPIDGVVLVTPFDSLTEVARASAPWAPVRRLFRHQMPVLDDLRNSAVPVALIVAGRDTIIPPARAEALAAGLEAAGRPARSVQRLDAGHNEIYGHPGFAPGLRAAISDVME